MTSKTSRRKFMAEFKSKAAIASANADGTLVHTVSSKTDDAIGEKSAQVSLFAIIGLYSRYVAGWSVSNTMTAEWCVGVLEDAIARNGKPEIINSDQGSQFTSECYIDLLKSAEIEISMDGKGRAVQITP